VSRSVWRRLRIERRGRHYFAHVDRHENGRQDTAKPDGAFIYVGTYPSDVVARAEYEAVEDLHAFGAVGTYDAAVVSKDAAGKVLVNKDEMATRHGAWAGFAKGPVVGFLFPPSIIGTRHGHRRGGDRGCQRSPVAGHVACRRQGVRGRDRCGGGCTCHRG
jgi:hypothetical protein